MFTKKGPTAEALQYPYTEIVCKYMMNEMDQYVLTQQALLAILLNDSLHVHLKIRIKCLHMHSHSLESCTINFYR